MKRRIATVVLAALALAGAAPSLRAQAAEAGAPAEVGVEERLGAMAPLDLTFNDETGTPVKLRDFVKKPTLLLLVFYHCPVACNLLLSELADCAKTMPVKAGQDYQILTISFDDEDGPKDAAERKANYVPGLGPAFPADQWKFMYGDAASIKALTEAVGYKYQKQDSRAFVHPNVLVVLSPSGKIIRYIYGPEFQPFVVGMALAEATRDTPGVSIRKMLSYCFSYDPKGKRYVLDTMKIAGFSILVGVGLFILFLSRSRRRKTHRTPAP